MKKKGFLRMPLPAPDGGLTYGAACVLITLFCAAVLAQGSPEASADAANAPGAAGKNAVVEQSDYDLVPDNNVDTPDNSVRTVAPASPAPDPEPTTEPVSREPLPADSVVQVKAKPVIKPDTTPEFAPAPEPVLAAQPEIIPETMGEPPAPPRRKKQKREPQMVVPSPLSSAFVFPAGFISYNKRYGYRKYPDVAKYHHIPRSDMFIYGGAAGKRLALKIPRLRVQASVEAGGGSSEESAFPLEFEDGSSITIYERIYLWTIGAQVDMHVLFPTRDNSRMFFISFGPGVHSVTFHHAWELKSGQELLRDNEITTVPLSANIGAGVEYKMGRHRAASLSYNLRIWKPICYTDSRMFPMGDEYNEYFFSHALQAQILLPARWAIGFR